MPLFHYTALGPKGKKLTGVIDADSLKAAKERLLKQKILVIKLLEKSRSRKKEIKLPPPVLLAFTRDLAQLLDAGLPLYESLLAIEEKYRDQKYHSLFLDLCDQVKQGKSLSVAMACYSKSFNSLHTSMVAAGEESGSLSAVFRELTLLIERQQKLKKQMGSALIYPAFLLAFCSVVISALFFYLIPSMEELFEGRRLHPLTQTVLSLSHWLHAHGQILAILFATSLLGALLFFRRPKGKRLLQRIALMTPILKNLLTQAVFARFSRALSVLLTSGVPMIEALKLSRKVMHNPFFEEIVEKAEVKIIEGSRLSEEFKKSPLVPKLVIRMLAIAEETASTPIMLTNISKIYEEDLEKSLTRFTSLLQPVILLILGVIIGTVMLSVLLPLTDVSSFVG